MQMRNKKLLIAGEPKSINTQRLKSMFVGKFEQIEITEGIDFSFKNFFKAFFAVKRLLKRYQPDLIILYQVNLTAFVTALAKKKGIPTIAIAIGSDVLLMPKRGWLFKKILSYTLQHSDAYSANTPYLMEQMKRYCLPDKPFALSHLGITPIEASKKEDIVFSNRLHKPLYRIEDIIRAFVNFVSMSEYKDWKLVIAAEGNENKLKELANSLGIVEKVEFVGWLSSEENAKYYAKSRIFVSIPQSDSMPTSLLEAMSAGCIPVISDLPSYRGLVEHGRNALVVSDKEIRSGDYLHKAFELDTEVLIRNNKVFTDEFATIESNKQRLWDLIDKISL